MPRFFFAVLSTLCLSTFVHAEVSAPGAAAHATSDFERRIAGRAANQVKRLQLSDDERAGKARAVVTRFYRDLNAAQEQRDQQLQGIAPGDLAQLHRAQFEADKRIQTVYGELIGGLAAIVDEKQIEALKDGMTFDMVPLSFATYQRLFPDMNARQKTQVYDWLVDAREIAIVAGSAETKLDVFRVNKMRMHAYLAAQGFDVDAVLKAEEARKTAEKTQK